MTNLQRLYETFGQSPWLDDLSRAHIADGRLAALVRDGIRGVTSNPTIFARAMESSSLYDDRLAELVRSGHSVEQAYWELVVDDVRAACDVLGPVHAASGGTDGFVSIEVAPALADDTPATVAAARDLARRVGRPNLLVKVPGTVAGLDAIRQLVSEGANVNVTLLFGLERYAAVIDAYLEGLEALVRAGGDPAQVHSVASFFVSRVDTEVDRRLESLGTPEALALRGRAAIAQARLAYQLFRQRFAGPRWDALRARGAHLQRPLWASTSTKNPTYPDTMYIDGLIGPDTVTTMPGPTIAAFEDHGTLARTLDADPDEARSVVAQLSSLGIELADVAGVLEHEGVAAFTKSYNEALEVLGARAAALAS